MVCILQLTCGLQINKWKELKKLYINGVAWSGCTMCDLLRKYLLAEKLETFSPFHLWCGFAVALFPKRSADGKLLC